MVISYINLFIHYLYKNQGGKLMEFKEGQLVAYCPIDVHGQVYKVQLGVFKRYNEHQTAGYVWYHEGSTCTCTPVDFLYPIENSCYIKEHSFNSLDKEEA